MDLQAILHPHQWLLARYAARVRCALRSWRGPSELVETTYAVMLNRLVTPTELANWTGLLQQGKIKWTSLIWELLCSDEFQGLHPEWSLPRDPTQILHALHSARCLLVQNELPAADTILDLGGASTETASGALLGMGYPHPVRQVTIIDLPMDSRMNVDSYRFLASETKNWIDVDGVRVRYIHTSMTDMSAVAVESVDMIWSGQSIEHVTKADAQQVYAEAMRVLKPGGYFCLDTPNRTLTQLQYPFGYIHKEHKHEYRPAELLQHIKEAGFSVKRTLGICPMLRSVQHKRFYPQEILDHVTLASNAESSYFFYVESIKP